MIWLLAILLALLVAFVALALDDSRWRHRRLPRVTQLNRPRVAPPLPCGQWHPQFHLIRGRLARADHARYVYRQEL